MLCFLAALSTLPRVLGGGMFKTQSARSGREKRGCFWGHLVPGGRKGQEGGVKNRRAGSFPEEGNEGRDKDFRPTWQSVCPSTGFLKKIFFVLFFRVWKGGREKEREGNINVWLPLTCPTLSH